MKNKFFVLFVAALLILGFTSDASGQTKKAQSYSSLDES